MLRIRKINSVISNLNQHKDVKNSFKRLYVIFLLVLICHIQSCLIYWIVAPTATWIPPLDFGAIETDVFDIENKSFTFRYFKMLYHSTLVYSMVDITVRTGTELLGSCFMIILSAVINAIIYG